MWGIPREVKVNKESANLLQFCKNVAMSAHVFGNIVLVVLFFQ